MTDVSDADEPRSRETPLKPSVYVVDDDAGVLASVRFLLETEGFDVRTFDDSAALLDFDARANADCLVIDYKIPRMDGLELVKRLRQLAIATPVVFITGSCDATFRARAAAVAVSRVLLKPHIEESLAASVRAAIRDGRLAQEQRQLRDIP